MTPDQRAQALDMLGILGFAFKDAVLKLQDCAVIGEQRAWRKHADSLQQDRTTLELSLEADDYAAAESVITRRKRT